MDKEVSIHAPTWGATLHAQESFEKSNGFNPRAHVGRDINFDMLFIAILLFQSTRPRGARLMGIRSPTSFVCFNPRAHVGRDLPEQRTFAGLPVSIHAPTWGATAY